MESDWKRERDKETVQEVVAATWIHREIQILDAIVEVNSSKIVGALE